MRGSHLTALYATARATSEFGTPVLVHVGYDAEEAPFKAHVRVVDPAKGQLLVDSWLSKGESFALGGVTVNVLPAPQSE